MKQIVLDLELTQVADRKPQIIEIGAVIINTKTFKIGGCFNMLAKPPQPEDRVLGLGDISTYEGPSTVSKLTGITSSMVEKATPLREVLIEFWDWVEQSGCGFRLADWGGGDIRQLEEASSDLNVAIKKRIKSLDLKQVFSPIRQMKNAKARGGLGNTLELFDLPFLGTPHRAYDDALNTALLYLDFLSTVEKTYFMEKQFKNGNKNILAECERALKGTRNE